MKKYISEAMEQYITEDKKPWHMPGHKRKSEMNPVFQQDFTEIPGLDDYHHPEGIIKESQKELAKVYHTYRSYYLVNGSTCGVLSAIYACCSDNFSKQYDFGLNSVNTHGHAGFSDNLHSSNASSQTNISDSSYPSDAPSQTNISDSFNPSSQTSLSDSSNPSNHSGRFIASNSVKNQANGLSTVGRKAILIARNCHKSVFNALELLNIVPIYIYPEYLEQGQIYGALSPDSIQAAILQHPNLDIRCCVLTSPTYEGVLSDIKSISSLLHQYRIPLVVDEAHGAWLPFSHRPEDSALYQGADLVIQSLHKTLPALTQTALIHISNPNCTDFRDQSHTHALASSHLPTTDTDLTQEPFHTQALASSQLPTADTDLTQEQKERLACLDTSLRHYLSIFQTSSPSYLFMKNMEECVAWCDEHRKDFALFEERIHNFRIKVRLLHNMRLLEPSLSPNTAAPAYKMDPSRLVFLFDRITGEEAARWLEEHSGIVVEMSGVNFITAISTVMDSIEDFDTLFQGLQALDQYLDSYENIHLPDKSAEIMLNTEKGMVPLKDSLGLRIRDYVYVYPPGIPLIAPYEVITQEMIHEIKLQVNAGKEIR